MKNKLIKLGLVTLGVVAVGVIYTNVKKRKNEEKEVEIPEDIEVAEDDEEDDNSEAIDMLNYYADELEETLANSFSTDEVTRTQFIDKLAVVRTDITDDVYDIQTNAERLNSLIQDVHAAIEEYDKQKADEVKVEDLIHCESLEDMTPEQRKLAEDIEEGLEKAEVVIKAMDEALKELDGKEETKEEVVEEVVTEEVVEESEEPTEENETINKEEDVVDQPKKKRGRPRKNTLPVKEVKKQ